MDEKAFLESVRFEDLKDKYLSEKELVLTSEKRRFREAREKRERDLIAGIEDDRRHRETLTLCINPFAHEGFQPYELGYRFLRGAPLYELDVANFDFLLVNLEFRPPVVMFGEAKGSVSNPGRVVKEVLNRKATALNEMAYVKENYLRGTADPRVETVLAVPAVDAIQVMEAIVEEGGGIIPWMVDRGDNVLSLKLPNHIDGPLRASMLHGDNDLNQALKKMGSLARGFNIFPQSHPVTKLRMLVASAQRIGRSLIVDTNILLANLQADLFYLEPMATRELQQEILSLGFDIGLLREVDNEIRLSTRWTDRGAVEEEINSRWVGKRLEQRRRREEEEAILTLQAQITDELQGRPGLQTFDR